MELIRIDSDEKYERILQVLEESRLPEEHVWTSGTDLGNENNFYWVTTGKHFELEIWHDTQPDNYLNKENCVELCTWPINSYKFNDYECNKILFFVCNSITYDIDCQYNINI